MKINQKTQGIMYIVGAAFFFALMNLFVRLAGDVPTFQKCFFRNIVAAFVAIIMLHKNHVKFQIGKGNLKYLLIRATAGLLGIICNFYAVDHLPISDASLLNKLSPFFAIIFSTIILKEKLTVVKAVAMISSFIGVVILSVGSGSSGNGNVMLGIGNCVVAAACYGLFSVLNKKANYVR